MKKSGSEPNILPYSGKRLPLPARAASASSRKSTPAQPRSSFGVTKQDTMKTSEIIAAVENGAKWQWSYSPKEGWEDGSKLTIANLCYYLGNPLGYNVRLTPQKKTVPLGPEDWDGIWFVRGPKGNTKFMVTGVGPDLIYLGPNTYYHDHIKCGWERSRDGKTWEPCHKEVEE